MRKSVALILCASVVGYLHQPTSVLAATSTWTGPGSDFNTVANWSAGVPNDVAAFTNNPPTPIDVTNVVTLNEIDFTGASAYTLTLQTNGGITFAGAGIQ